MHNFKALIRSLLAHLQPSEAYYGILLPSFFINILGLVFPLMILQFYDRIIPNQAYQTLTILTLIVIMVIGLEIVLKISRAAIIHWSSARFEHQESCQMFADILQSPAFQKRDLATGEYLDRMSGLFNMKDFYGGQVLSLLVDLPFVFIYLVLIAYIGGLLVVVTLIMLAIFILTADYMGVCLQTVLSQRKESDDKRYNFIIETLNGIQSIKTNALESFMRRRYEKLQLNAAVKDYRIARLSLNSMIVSAYLVQITTISVVAIGSLKVVGGTLTIGGLAACTLLANRSMVPLSAAMMYWKRVQAILISQQRQSQVHEKALAEKTETPTLKPALNGQIELNDVCFGFEKEPLFDHLNLKVPAKATIAIKGQGSSGKTSLLKLIQGIYKPNAGTVLIDTIDIQTIDPEWLHQQIAYLPQHSDLFNGTIIENLTLFDKSKIPEALDLVKAMGLEHIIHKMPDGYETKVGDQVLDTLHAGTKQQIVTIQNILKKPKIVLFDESNSALDFETDQKFIALLTWLKKRTTLIIISHRPSLLRIADTIYDLRDGKLFKESS
ncbi:peptidase domain-containing ABC transporter [Legionella sp. W05-934-2]|jgi:ATP-binding cassette subfamily C protein LapB|uniref:peptidase domain-containing ABC transporter n=1 Tax=Legionella sp. W05-934-2 TaxID=1198649 RepID=UPI003462EF9F